MKILRFIWSRFAAMVLALLMILGMAACAKQPAEPASGEAGQENTQTQDQDQTNDQQGEQTQDQEQTTDKQEDTNPDADQNQWELPEDVFEDIVDETPSDETPSDEKPSDEKPSDDKPSGEQTFDGGVIVLPEDVWE